MAILPILCVRENPNYPLFFIISLSVLLPENPIVSLLTSRFNNRRPKENNFYQTFVCFDSLQAEIYGVITNFRF